MRTAEEKYFRILALTGQIEGYRKKINWGNLHLYAVIACIGTFVGFVGSTILWAVIQQP